MKELSNTEVEVSRPRVVAVCRCAKKWSITPEVLTARFVLYLFLTMMAAVWRYLSPQEYIQSLLGVVSHGGCNHSEPTAAALQMFDMLALRLDYWSRCAVRRSVGLRRSEIHLSTTVRDSCTSKQFFDLRLDVLELMHT